MSFSTILQGKDVLSNLNFLSVLKQLDGVLIGDGRTGRISTENADAWGDFRSVHIGVHTYITECNSQIAVTMQTNFYMNIFVRMILLYFIVEVHFRGLTILQKLENIQGIIVDEVFGVFDIDFCQDAFKLRRTQHMVVRNPLDIKLVRHVEVGISDSIRMEDDSYKGVSNLIDFCIDIVTIGLIQVLAEISFFSLQGVSSDDDDVGRQGQAFGHCTHVEQDGGDGEQNECDKLFHGITSFLA